MAPATTLEIPERMDDLEAATDGLRVPGVDLD
jgi:hypothetical protein